MVKVEINARPTNVLNLFILSSLYLD
jgi:hypothetical protein